MALNNPYALSFDGIDDYTSSPFQSNFSQITIEAWIRPVFFSSYRVVIAQKHPSLNEFTFGLRFYNNSLTYYQYNTYLTSTFNFVVNQLVHIAVTYDGQYIRMYINGTENCYKAHTGALVASSQPLLIGSWAGQDYNGYIDEVRIWDHARTQEQIQANMNKKLLGNETGLYVYYRFDEGSGTNLIDSTSNAWNGTIYGATWVPGEVDLTESELPGAVLLSAHLAGGASMSVNTIRGRGLSASLSAGSTLSSALIRTRGLSANLTAGAELSTKMNLIASLTSHLAGGATLHAGLLRLFIYEGIYEITKDDYFTKSQPAKSDELANVIKVYTNPLQPAAVAEEVYKSNDPISIDPGTSKTTTIFYSEKPVIEAVASLTEAGPNLSITNATYYAWGASITISNAGTAAETCKIVVNGRPLRVQGRQLITKQDDVSIQENGRIEFEFPDNPLVQTPEMAEKIATKLLAFAIPRRDVELVWRGNPALTLADVVQIPEYQKGLVDKRGLFYITRQQFEFDGGLRVTTEGRKIK